MGEVEKRNLPQVKLFIFNNIHIHGCVGCMYMYIKHMEKSNEEDGVIPKIIA